MTRCGRTRPAGEIGVATGAASSREPAARLTAVRRRPIRGLTTAVILASVTLAVGVIPAAGSTTTSSGLPTLQATSATGARTPAAVSGLIRAPGGPYLYDRQGRVVFFHGVDAVYKYPPYELYPAPGKPWNFSAADASLMARLGFNVVRLGMTWSGLEPGTAPANDPAICGRGAPTDPHQFNQAVFDRYVQRLQATVDLFGSVPHLHDPGHAPGRVQRDVRRRGRPELGRLHERRAERRPAGSLVPRVRHAGGRHRLPPLLAQ